MHDQTHKNSRDSVCRAVTSILDQIQDLLRIKSVRRRSGEVVDFAADRIGLSFSDLFNDIGIRDEVLLAKCTHQALVRLDREFGGGDIPTTDDITRIVCTVLIDNNLSHCVKKFLQCRAVLPEKERRFMEGGLSVRRHYTEEGVHPYDEVEWERREAVIRNEKGEAVFEQHDVEVPKSWSQTATNIVSSKYFRGHIGKSGRETSVRQVIDRVAGAIAEWGRKDGYFATERDAEAFEAELMSMLVNQRAAFNSPVWFNVGVNSHPQCSACFINSVRDDMRSILNLAVTEGMLFKYGSGTGTNLSTLRSSKEALSNSNGKSSGPVSFMKGYDAFAGVIKSGGKTRRAAKMVILNADHPDIEEFIECKAKEEKKAHALVDAGYDSSIDGDAYGSIYFQNANNSVRVPDDFMRAVLDDSEWQTRAVTTGETVETLRAKGMMEKICRAAWECGDPGIQYDTTVNRWNTVTNSGRINGSNPCSEFMFLDDSACNLASLNLMKFQRQDGGFDTGSFRHAVQIMITAQDILVGNSSYPTPSIEENSLSFRALGIGYANLGALLMSRGHTYDSDEGRNFAAAVTALLTGHAYRHSSRIAGAQGAFQYYKLNEEPFLKVIGMHRDHAYAIPGGGVPTELAEEARRAWDNALEGGMAHGFRNSQVSLLAPTGTIGFFMDCDTTGIEPDIALVKYKWLVGGGLMKIVNSSVQHALCRLGYGEREISEILHHLERAETIEGAPHLKDEHLSVFDCAFTPANGERSIHYMGHVHMMAAVQPFISGAISKTVNLPNSCTSEDIKSVYTEGWKLGLKAIAVYRDGSKRQQVLTTAAGKDSRSDEGKKDEALVDAPATPEETADTFREEAVPATMIRVDEAGEDKGLRPLRRRLPDERRSITHKFSIANHKGYITVGLYENGQPGEIFILMAKGGSVVSGLMDAFATSTSIALQYGVPLAVLVNKFVHVRFEPSGITKNPDIRIAKSIVDYIFRWLALKFLSEADQRAVGVHVSPRTLGETGREEVAASATSSGHHVDGGGAGVIPQADPGPRKDEVRAPSANSLTISFDTQSDAPPCDTCGAIMVRNASCYKCLNCGSTSGCS